MKRVLFATMILALSSWATPKPEGIAIPGAAIYAGDSILEDAIASRLSADDRVDFSESDYKYLRNSVLLKQRSKDSSARALKDSLRIINSKLNEIVKLQKDRKDLGAKAKYIREGILKGKKEYSRSQGQVEYKGVYYILVSISSSESEEDMERRAMVALQERAKEEVLGLQVRSDRSTLPDGYSSVTSLTSCGTVSHTTLGKEVLRASKYFYMVASEVVTSSCSGNDSISQSAPMTPTGVIAIKDLGTTGYLIALEGRMPLADSLLKRALSKTGPLEMPGTEAVVQAEMIRADYKKELVEDSLDLVSNTARSDSLLGKVKALALELGCDTLEGCAEQDTLSISASLQALASSKEVITDPVVIRPLGQVINAELAKWMVYSIGSIKRNYAKRLPSRTGRMLKADGSGTDYSTVSSDSFTIGKVIDTAWIYLVPSDEGGFQYFIIASMSDRPLGETGPVGLPKLASGNFFADTIYKDVIKERIVFHVDTLLQVSPMKTARKVTRYTLATIVVASLAYAINSQLKVQSFTKQRDKAWGDYQSGGLDSKEAHDNFLKADNGIESETLSRNGALLLLGVGSIALGLTFVF